MVIVMLAGVMFPLWPVKLRVGVWYLSIAALVFIGAMIVLAIVRLIFWCITVLAAKRAIWIFPNLFEDVGFVSGLRLFSYESFTIAPGPGHRQLLLPIPPWAALTPVRIFRPRLGIR